MGLKLCRQLIRGPLPLPTLKGGGRDTTRDTASEAGGKLGYKEAAAVD